MLLRDRQSVHPNRKRSVITADAATEWDEMYIVLEDTMS
jgi:hypothetical protein